MTRNRVKNLVRQMVGGPTVKVRAFSRGGRCCVSVTLRPDPKARGVERGQTSLVGVGRTWQSALDRSISHLFRAAA